MDSSNTELPAHGEASTKSRVRWRPLRAAAGWIVAGALIYSPFAFGSIPPFAIRQLNIMLAAAAGLWLLDCIVTRKAPRIPIWLIVCSAAALAICWFMMWNARSAFVLRHLTIMRLTIRPHRPGLPGGIDVSTSLVTMFRLDALAAALLVASDMARLPLWRWRWLNAIACGGAAIAAFGVAQIGGLRTFVPTRMKQLEGEYFSTFNYHGNAGAYMNLGLAATVSLCLLAFENRSPALIKWFYSCLAACILAGVVENTSRGAQAISLAMLLAFGWFAFARLAHRRSKRYRWPVLAVGAVALVIVLAAAALHAGHNEVKWRELPSELAKNSSRWQVWRVTVPMARSAGPFGHGPGSFKLLLPASPMLSDALLSRWVLQPRILPGAEISMWSMAHDDYLQTWVEFGWVGLALACTVLFGGISIAVRKLRTILRQESDLRDCYVLIGALAALAGVSVHALFDFPLQIASIQVTVVVLLGICWSARNWSSLAQ